MKQDVYSRITSQIVAELEKGVRPWHRPWNADHAAGRITKASDWKPDSLVALRRDL